MLDKGIRKNKKSPSCPTQILPTCLIADRGRKEVPSGKEQIMSKRSSDYQTAYDTEIVNTVPQVPRQICSPRAQKTGTADSGKRQSGAGLRTLPYSTLPKHAGRPRCAVPDRRAARQTHPAGGTNITGKL